MTDALPWTEEIRLKEVGRSPLRRRLAADEAVRARVAEALGLNALHRLEALVSVTPWLDGAQVEGRWSASYEQTCGVTLEPFETQVKGEFEIRVVPRGSRNAPEDSHEVSVDPEAEDPPDVLEEDRIDIAAYVVEHLALEVDPFPRKPGAVFDPPEPEEPPSPFAVLRRLEGEGGGS
jgi:uncharacterized metal-binding protein YceD (DUF177 family)